MNLLKKIRESKLVKPTALFLANNLFLILIVPGLNIALTSGAGQEEFASFESASTSDMVDLYSGDFTYNIPLLSVPGPNGSYPINISYHSGVNMEQEASWVGLGWNINVGALNRELRGLPDDFNGDNVKQTMHLKPSWTLNYSWKYKKDSRKEMFGFQPTLTPEELRQEKLPHFQVYYNNNRGLGLRVMCNLQNLLKLGSFGKLGANLSYDTQGGFGVSPSLNIDAGFMSINQSASFNNREGMGAYNLSSSISGQKSKTTKRKNKPNKVQGGGYTGGSTLSFGMSHGVPGVNIPMKNIMTSFVVPLGTTEKKDVPLFGYFESNGKKYIEGYINYSEVADGGIVNSKAYGYLNTKENLDYEDESKMLDFDREEFQYSKNLPNLAPSHHTYDIYSYSGQGTGGVFRPYQTSTLTLGTRKQVSNSYSNNITVEFGSSGSNYHITPGYSYQSGESSTGRWKIDGLEQNNQVGRDRESVYFQDVSEMAGNLKENDYLSYWKNEKALRLKLAKDGVEYISKPSFVTSSIDTDEISLNNAKINKAKRQPRSKVIQGWNHSDASNYGYNRKDTEKSSFAKGHHLGEMVITQENGMKYVYGKAAYNSKKIDVKMNYKGNEDVSHVDRITKDDYKVGNEFFSETELPPYPHSWLLTHVISADYIDVNNNGEVDDKDYGYWVKFEYDQLDKPYKWRLPYKGASFNAGDLTNEKDGNASFSYGEKELYYLKTITTKSHIAKFELDDREDALGVNHDYSDNIANEPVQKMQSLDRIKLYTKKEYENNPNPIPIKVVHFKYNYELCPHVENNSRKKKNVDGEEINEKYGYGKLTLKKLYFTYQNSKRGEISPYIFHYAKESHNPAYSKTNVDRWGEYKDNSSKPTGFPSARYPYSDQEYVYNEKKEKVRQETVDNWSLKKIDLPSGGNIQIDYESDDYAYVENKKATQMYNVVGMGKDKTSVDPKLKSGEDEDLRVYFSLNEKENEIDLSNEAIADQFIVKNYIGELNKIWFKTLMSINVKTNTNNLPEYDYVSGYVKINKSDPSKYGVISPTVASRGKWVGYITMEKEELSEKWIGPKVHPMIKLGIQFLRENRRELVFDAFNPQGGVFAKIGNLLTTASSSVEELKSTFTGFNNYAYSYINKINFKQYARQIRLEGYTIIKLQDSDGIKYGGGNRVKRLTMQDNWVNAGQYQQATYGQEYDYSIEEDGRKISSGVAYEPPFGGEESALRSPIEYDEKPLLASNRSLFIENPILESYYPAASVGYRKVTVQSIGAERAKEESDNKNDLASTSAPISVYEFYTAKDFPVITDATDLSHDKASYLFYMIPGVYSTYNKYEARSQGYSITLNDMPGKMKRVSQYTKPEIVNGQIVKQAQLISSQQYIYNTKEEYSENKINELENEVDVFTGYSANGGIYNKALIGQTYDMFVDMQENRDESSTSGGEANIDLMLPSFFIMPTLDISDSEISQKLTVTMKVVHKKGILKEIIATDQKSIIKTENLVFDPVTGSVLLTKVTNEYNDPIYNINFPAHWAYNEGVGPAYKYGDITYDSNDNLEMKGCVITPKLISDFEEFPNECFVRGAEIYVEGIDRDNKSVSFLGHVTGGGNRNINIITKDGLTNIDLITISQLTWYRPTPRNLLSSSIGNLAFKKLSLNITTKTQDFSEILASSAITLTDEWNPACNACGLDYDLRKNAYQIGKKGIWRQHKSYSYLTNRLYESNSRKDGVFDEYQFFTWGRPDLKPAKWTEVNEATIYSEQGYELENMNALGIYSSAIYGYNNSLPVSVTGNSKYNQSGYDGFEDYDDSDCDDHLGFKRNKTETISEQSHTGKKSIKVTPSKPVTLRKKIGICYPKRD